jgi:hypothetical protein
VSQDNAFVTYCSSFAPVIIISLLNVIIPSLTKIHAKIENYDFPETRIKMEIWRSYISKMFNLFLFLALNMPNLSEALGLSDMIKSETNETQEAC